MSNLSRRFFLKASSIAAAIEALDAVRSQGRYRHKKRGGTYALLGTAEAQASAPIDDGRFEPLPQPPTEGT